MQIILEIKKATTKTVKCLFGEPVWLICTFHQTIIHQPQFMETSTKPRTEIYRWAYEVGGWRVAPP